MVAMQETWEASRRLLRRVRDVMGAGGSAQERLDRVVRIIASEMVAEVCSVYIRRSGNLLVLAATEGLKPEAVGFTRLAVGEGLVGLIAEQAQPLALAEAQSHPNFAYRPETGEEIYHSLMGVPILRGGRVTGVLVVQNRTRRNYTEDEIETLETVAMVLAEVAASDELAGREALLATDQSAARPTRLTGIQLSPGLATGVAVLHEPRVPIGQMVAEDPEAEQGRLNQALVEMYSSLDSMFAAADLAGAGEHRDVLETYLMFAQDRGWLERIRETVQGGLTAEAAVRKVQDDMRARLRQARDPYIRERLHDLDDLSNRLVQHLAGAQAAGDSEEIPENAVLVARSMGPAELLDYPRERLRGVILEEGAPDAHVAIVARALELPMVGGVEDALGAIGPRDPVIVDGSHGQVLVRPSEDVQQLFDESLRVHEQRRALYAALRDLPAVTLDGVETTLLINAGLLIDVEHLHDSGAAGIGLYRTEVPFMIRDRFPDVDEQAAMYLRVLELANGKPVVFRTLDIGGDKLLPYWRAGRDENPALGWRSLRVALDRPFLMHEQLRALIRAASGRELRVMFPMVTEVAELEEARAILDTELRREARRSGQGPERVLVGAMFEVPALMWQLPALLPRVDFLSVGSNDLLQFLFAADRGNPRLAGRYDVLSSPVFSMLRMLVTRCAEAGVPVTFCGEMAGQPLEAMALIGLGFRAISMPPPRIGPVKLMIRSLRLQPLQDYMRRLETLSDRSLRDRLRAYAADHGIAV